MSFVDVSLAVEHIERCKNFDGGFGVGPGAESHAGQIFACLGALTIAKRLDLVDKDRLGAWLSERQLSNGGLNGRPEKLEDVCYSWWVLSSLAMIDRLHWIQAEKLSSFILRCQASQFVHERTALTGAGLGRRRLRRQARRHGRCLPYCIRCRWAESPWLARTCEGSPSLVGLRTPPILLPLIMKAVCLNASSRNWWRTVHRALDILHCLKQWSPLPSNNPHDTVMSDGIQCTGRRRFQTSHRHARGLLHTFEMFADFVLQ